MNIQKVCGVTFSAVGNTRKTVGWITETIADALHVPAFYVDFTLPEDRRQPVSFAADELVVFGTPTYAGRVPNKVLPMIQSLFHGDQTPTVAVVTFGNRNFDSSLTELQEELMKLGFCTFAAGAFASEHAFSGKIGSGRPDEADRELIRQFAGKAAGIVQNTEAAAGLHSPVQIRGGEPVGPYYTPLKENGEPAVFLKAKPVTDPALCDDCGLCAAVCPMGSIDAADLSQVPGICIKCQACVKKCPTGAKQFTDADFLSHVAMLEQNYRQRAGSEVFYAGGDFA